MCICEIYLRRQCKRYSTHNSNIDYNFVYIKTFEFLFYNYLSFYCLLRKKFSEFTELESALQKLASSFKSTFSSKVYVFISKLNFWKITPDFSWIKPILNCQCCLQISEMHILVLQTFCIKDKTFSMYFIFKIYYYVQNDWLN